MLIILSQQVKKMWWVSRKAIITHHCHFIYTIPYTEYIFSNSFVCIFSLSLEIMLTHRCLIPYGSLHRNLGLKLIKQPIARSFRFVCFTSVLLLNRGFLWSNRWLVFTNCGVGNPTLLSRFITINPLPTGREKL